MHPLMEELIQRYPDLTAITADIEAAFDILTATYRRGGKLLVCGNGGSSSDSDHIVGELMKGMCLARPLDPSLAERLSDSGIGARLQQGLPAISLSAHTGVMTAIINDQGNDLVFAQQVLGYGVPGDVLWALSTSGKAVDVVYALQVAKALGLTTIGLTGAGGGSMLPWCDVTIKVPFRVTHEVQERHLPIYHTLCRMVEQAFFGGPEAD
jgi:phosphoheptose isomerase